MSTQNDIQIVPQNDSWAVMPVGAEQASSLHQTRSEALAEGRRLAFRENASLVVRGPDGRAVQSLEVDIHRLPEKFSELISSTDSETEITVMDGGVPRAKLLPLSESTGGANKPRLLGLNAGAVLWMSDDFDEPLPAEFWLGDNP